MNQNKAILHSKVFDYVSLLECPYRTYGQLINHIGLLDSDKLWSKLIKVVSLARKITLSHLLTSLGSLRQTGQIQRIETKWAQMGVLALMVFVLSSIGSKQYKSRPDTTHSKISVLFRVIKGNGKAELAVDIYGPQDLEKEELSKSLHALISSQCEGRGFRLTEEGHPKKQFIVSNVPLVFQDVKFPHILEVFFLDHKQSPGKCQLVTKITEQNLIKSYQPGLTFSQYFNLLDYFPWIPENKSQFSLASFVKLTFEKLEELLKNQQKYSKYFCVIQPDKIIVIDKQEKLRFQIRLKSTAIYFYHQTKLPQNFHVNLYSYKQSPQEIDKFDRWSLALVILGTISKYQNREAFQNNFMKAIKNQEINKFLEEEIDRIYQEGEFEENIIRYLKQWLRVDKENVLPPPPTRVGVQTDGQGQQATGSAEPSRPRLDWLQRFLDPKTSKTNNAQKEPQRPKNKAVSGQIEPIPQQSENNQNDDLQFIRSLNSGPKDAQINQEPIKSHQKNNQNPLESNKNVQKDVKSTFANNEVLHSQGDSWKRYQKDLKEDSQELTRFKEQKDKQIKMDQLYFQKHNIFAYKINLDNNATVKYILDSKEIYEQMGYFSQDAFLIKDHEQKDQKEKLKGQEQKTKDKKDKYKNVCPKCKKKDIILNGCEHIYCLYCDDKKIAAQDCLNKPIKCLYKGCQAVLSYEVFSFFLKKSSRCENIVKQLIQRYAKTAKIKVKQCKRTARCMEASPLFMMQKKNRLFFCELCSTFICIECCQEFHGNMECKKFKEMTEKCQQQKQGKLKQFFKLKEKKINTVSFQKLLKYLQISYPFFIDRLQALLRAAVVSIWMNDQYWKYQKDEKKSVTILQSIVPSLNYHLINFLKNIQDIGSKSDQQLKKRANELQSVVEPLKNISKYWQAVIYHICKA